MFLQGLIPPQPTQPWRLPPQGLAVFHGECDAPRLSHYFLPRLALEGKRILFLDGANCANPRLMARLAERRGLPFAQISRQIKIARAFTCFQLTELIRRVPQFLADFPAQVLMVTAFPELYFDEDVRDADAQAAFRQALGHLRRWGQNETRNSQFETCKASTEFRVSNFEFRPSIENRQSKIDNGQSPAPSTQHPAVTVALFSSASRFQPPACRKHFFTQTCAAAAELWKFQLDGQGRLGLTPQTEDAGVARTPVFGVRGSSLAKQGISKMDAYPQVQERESREEPQTSKTEVYATFALAAPQMVNSE